MAELSTEERVKLAVSLIEQSPPGEVNDVINDIRAIIADDDALMAHSGTALKSYNLAQLHAVLHEGDGGEYSSLLSDAAVLPGSNGERYIDSEGGRSFAFDHIKLVATDYQPYNLPPEEDAFRAGLLKSLKAYAANHYPGGHVSVVTDQFALLPPEEPEPEPVAEAAAVAEPERTALVTETEALAVNTEEGGAVDELPSPVTDVVDEQVGSGLQEHTSTPVVAGIPQQMAGDHEVDEPGGLAELDREVEAEKEKEDAEEAEEAKEEAAGEGAADPTEEAVGETAAEQTPKEAEVEAAPVAAADETAEVAVVEETAPVVAALAEPKAPRVQPRIENPKYTLEIVGNRYNPNNFWTGRWRSRWTVDQAAGTVDGEIRLDAHYFEQGNVQLATDHAVTFACPTAEAKGQGIASQIVTSISKIESEYQLEMHDVYTNLSDRAFRALRRALPVTRQKIDWEKVSGYTLGADLSKARA